MELACCVPPLVVEFVHKILRLKCVTFVHDGADSRPCVSDPMNIQDSLEKEGHRFFVDQGLREPQVGISNDMLHYFAYLPSVPNIGVLAVNIRCQGMSEEYSLSRLPFLGK